MPQPILENLFAREGAQITAEVRALLREAFRGHGDLVDLTFLDGGKPILLLPLRLETRFKGSDLWIRAFPDTISIDQHQPLLTAKEEEDGAKFVADLAAAAEDEAARRAAWALLQAGRPTGRASWIARHCSAATGSPAPVAAARSTAQPVVRTLPERLAYITVSRAADPATGKPRVRGVLGAPIPEELAVGPDPGDVGESLKRAADRDFALAGPIAWLGDLGKAEELGMAACIAGLDAFELSEGFAQVLVLGVRTGTDAAAQQHAFEALLAAHRHTDGLSLVPQGTPTNNPGTGGEDAARPEPDPFDLEWATRPAAGPFQDLEDDGARLAHLLGVAPDTFARVAHADGRDGAEAVAMKRALWGGTLGYFLDEMLKGVFSEDTIRKTRRFFTQFVFARGPVSALRVGDQPYGIIPSTRFDSVAFGDWSFETRLRDALARARIAWDGRTDEVERVGRTRDPDRTITEILRQYPASVSFGQTRLVGKDFRMAILDLNGLPRTVVSGDEARIELMAADIVAALSHFFPDLSLPAKTKLLTLAERWHKDLNPRLEGQPVDDKGLRSETRPVSPLGGLPVDEALGRPWNYLDWLAEAEFAAVSEETFPPAAEGEIAAPRSLLYLLLRHSYLTEHAASANDLSRFVAALHEEPGGSVDLQVETANLFVRAPQAPLLDLVGRTFEFEAGRAETVADFAARRKPSPFGVDMEYRADWADLAGTLEVERPGAALFERVRARSAGLREFRDGLNVLRGLPSARLERLFAEHVDLCSCRIDAWMTGLVYQKALGRRLAGDSRRLASEPAAYPPERQGLYLGAFGYVEDLRPRPRQAADTAAMPAALRQEEPVWLDPASQGVVHAPSLDHAATAAVLKSGERSHRTADGSPLRVNLSSHRVRLASWICDGLRNGQPLGALLGYLFERKLHDRGGDLDKHLPALRAAFPTFRERGAPPAEGEAHEAIEARHVVDGLGLLADRQKASEIAGPDGAVILAIAGEVGDALDAVADLFVSESVHQLVKGNVTRAAGVLEGAAEATHVPQAFEVVETPRPGRPQVHRIAIAFDENAPSVSPWSGTSGSTPRARLEPVLNAWLGRVLGDPRATGVTVHLSRQGDGATHAEPVALADLGLEPIDFCIAVPDDPAGLMTEIEQRFSRVALDRRPEPGWTLQRVAWNEAGLLQPLIRWIPLVRSLKPILLASRPLGAADVRLPGDVREPEARGFDPGDLKTRLDELLADLLSVRGALAAAVAGAEPFETQGKWSPEASAALAALDTARIPLALFGLPDAMPQLQSTPGPQALDDGLEAGRRLLREVEARLGRAAGAVRTRRSTAPPEGLAAPPAELPPFPDGFDAPEPQVPPVPTEARDAAGLAVLQGLWTTGVLEAARELLGGMLVLAPRFAAGAGELADTIAAGGIMPDLGVVDPIETWLLGLSVVRPAVAALVNARLATPAGGEGLGGRPLILQLPLDAGPWCALPAAAPPRVPGTVTSMAVLAPSGLAGDGLWRGLLVDEWVEIVPDREQVTGIAFNFDRPGSEPPQALILAVAPGDAWDWDDLVESVTETFASAKRRLVVPPLRQDPEEDPDLDWDAASALTHFLPAILAEITSQPAPRSLDFLATVTDAARMSLARAFREP